MKQAFIVLLAFLAGCATQDQLLDRQLAGQPAEYRDGYKDGCDSGYMAAGNPYYRFSKEVSRYGTSALYKQGWDDGFAVCKGRYESAARIFR